MANEDTPSNAPEFSVSELSFSLKKTVEDAYGYVRVRGEISGYRGPHSSGHAYFALKDEKAKIDAVIWKGVFARLRFRPEEGMEVIATGKITTYPGKSSYQIVLETMQPAGVGALMAVLDERRKKLAAEGLFDAARKQLLPPFPKVIGVVTSPTGAVIRDILHRIADRFPVHVLVWPVRVQGETSAMEVAAAIDGFNALEAGGAIPRPDVLIVARGGGSLEDLWSFNEEVVVRAAARSLIPLVSAIGHETDTTLIDFAADLRAPTPTAAAEQVVAVRSDLLVSTLELGARLNRAISRFCEARSKELAASVRGLPRLDSLLLLPRQRLDMAVARLPLALSARIQTARLALVRARLTSPAHTLAQAQQRLETAQRRLHKGFDSQIAHSRLRMEAGMARLNPQLMQRPIESLRTRLETVEARRTRAWLSLIQQRSARLRAQAALLSSLSYHGVLARGFALVRALDGTALRTVGQISPSMHIEIELADGRVQAIAQAEQQTVMITKPEPPKKPKSAKAPLLPQDDLFS